MKERHILRLDLVRGLRREGITGHISYELSCVDARISDNTEVVCAVISSRHLRCYNKSVPVITLNIAGIVNKSSGSYPCLYCNRLQRGFPSVDIA